MRYVALAPLVVGLGIVACSDPSETIPADTAGSEPSPSDVSPADTGAADSSPADASPSDAARRDVAVGSSDADSRGGGDASGWTTFRVTSPRSDRPVHYRLKVVEQPEKVRDGSRFEAEETNDDITHTEDGWLITGEAGTAPSSEQVHGDSYRWSHTGDPEFGIAGWTADVPKEDYTITIDGTPVDPDALSSLTADPRCIGGGTCYDRRIRAGEADIQVGASATLEKLRSSLQSASRGDVVFIDPAADIDLGFSANSPSVEVPAGVTLASSRGAGGAKGARLHAQKKPGSDWAGSNTIRVHDDVRLTGLRIEGPTPDRKMNWRGGDHDYTDGIEAEGASGVEIDNNEVSGWPAAAIHGGDPVHVHHNTIHDNDQSGLGYGVSSSKWDSVVEYNDFRRNRHAVAGSGAPGVGYIVRYNVFGAEGIGGAGHKIDMHEDPDNAGHGGSRVEIYRNTVRFPDAQGVYLRATPRESAEIYRNWFYNPTDPCLTKNAGGYCAIQLRADDWTNVDYHDNHYGSSEPGCDIGAPRDGC